MQKKSESKIVKRASQKIKDLSVVLNNCSFHCDKFTISSSNYQIEIKWAKKGKNYFITSKIRKAKMKSTNYENETNKTSFVYCIISIAVLQDILGYLIAGSIGYYWVFSSQNSQCTPIINQRNFCINKNTMKTHLVMTFKLNLLYYKQWTEKYFKNLYHQHFWMLH